MIEFKQIIGRGTRLFDGKDYFTIYDFVKAYHHFNDPEWDGEPLEPEPCAEVRLPPLPMREETAATLFDLRPTPCECPKEPCAVCGQSPCVCKKKPKRR